MATEICFEIWALKQQSLNNKFADIECIFRKQEVGVEFLDFIHITPVKSSGKSATNYSNKSTKSQEEDSKQYFQNSNSGINNVSQASQ